MMSSTHLLLVLAAACIIITSEAVPLSGWTEGTASFFGGPQDGQSNAYKATIDSGSCGFGDFDPRLYPFYNVVGLHKSNALVANRPMDACGSCLEIQCNSGEPICSSTRPIQALISDQCEYDCSSTNLNIHVFGFEQLAKLRYGRMHIRYRLVECEPIDPITVHIMDYRSDGGWLRMALRNVAGDAALTAVDIAAATNGSDARDWMACKNTYGAVWEAGIGGVALPTPPLDLRITNSMQQQVIIRSFVAFAGVTGDVETTGQFPSPFERQAGTNSDSDAFVSPAGVVAPSVTVGMAISRPTNTLFGGGDATDNNNSTTTPPAGGNLNTNTPAPAAPATPAAAVPPAASSTVSRQPATPQSLPSPPAPVSAAQPPAPTKPVADQRAPQPVLRAPIKPQPAPRAAPPATTGTTTGTAPPPSSPQQAVDTSKQVVLAKQRPAATTTTTSGRRLLRSP